MDAYNNNLITHILSSIQNITENEELEFKGAKGGIPGSLWETYSAFANTDGGLLILGIKEKNGNLKSDRLTATDIDKLQKDLWSGLFNRNTVNINLLSNNDVKVVSYEDNFLLTIHVPRANRDQRPVHVGHDPYNGTYRRGYEGDFKCTKSEVSRMFSDANITHTADKRILKGFSFDDIDKESLRQYRQLFNTAKPDHIWSTYDDLKFLQQLGAYRKDRSNGIEGFTVAGILMFGTMDAITDDECLPNFFPDYRNETSFPGAERWIDRVYPDGTWVANLFQFYLRILPRLQSFLPKPFSVINNQRIDQSPAHIAIREAFVNLCVHADYQAEGSLCVIYKNGTYIFSNPGTMLVSRTQFFEGGESICRNPTIQKMFMMLGPAEKAGSGVAKIMEGWRSYNWIVPVLSEKNRPDKIEFNLSMQSLIQPEILDKLNNRLGIVSQTLPSEQQTVLALALTEGYVTNERLRYVLELHKSDITLLLQQMCRDSLLVAEGYGRGTKYRMFDKTLKLTDDNLMANDDSSVTNGDSSVTNGDSSVANDDSFVTNGDSSIFNNDSNISEENKIIYPNFSTSSLALLKKQRLSSAEMESVVCDICLEWRSIQEIAFILRKSIIHVRNNILSKLTSKGLLIREFPTIPNHPNQRYKSNMPPIEQ